MREKSDVELMSEFFGRVDYVPTEGTPEPDPDDEPDERI